MRRRRSSYMNESRRLNRGLTVHPVERMYEKKTHARGSDGCLRHDAHGMHSHRQVPHFLGDEGRCSAFGLQRLRCSVLHRERRRMRRRGLGVCTHDRPQRHWRPVAKTFELRLSTRFPNQGEAGMLGWRRRHDAHSWHARQHELQTLGRRGDQHLDFFSFVILDSITCVTERECMYH